MTPCAERTVERGAVGPELAARRTAPRGSGPSARALRERRSCAARACRRSGIRSRPRGAPGPASGARDDARRVAEVLASHAASVRLPPGTWEKSRRPGSFSPSAVRSGPSSPPTPEPCGIRGSRGSGTPPSPRRGRGPRRARPARCRAPPGRLQECPERTPPRGLGRLGALREVLLVPAAVPSRRSHPREISAGDRGGAARPDRPPRPSSA